MADYPILLLEVGERFVYEDREWAVIGTHWFAQDPLPFHVLVQRRGEHHLLHDTLPMWARVEPVNGVQESWWVERQAGINKARAKRRAGFDPYKG